MKRKTNKQREEQERAELLLQVGLVVAGATGPEWYGRDETFLTPGDLSRCVPALKRLFLREGEKNEYLFEARNLDKYLTASEIADFYYGNGVRALKELP